MTFLNVVEIESAVIALAANYPTASHLVTLPFLTAQGRQSHALRIGTGSCQRTGVLLISGTHAREWGGPDILVNLATDLLNAWSAHSGLAYGGTSFSSDDILRILERVELIVFPDINPDGRHYSQTVYSMWRKNRNPASSGGVASRIGVDDNRNYDFLWDYPTAFAPAAVGAGTLASNDPSSDLFHGTAAFSEAETKNVRWLFDQYPKIRRFIDIHSYGGNILHPWGDDANQSATTSKNFANPSWNGQRGVSGDAYSEYVVAGHLVGLQAAANAMQAAIAGVRGESYNVAQSFFMPGWPTPYPTSGASDDWAFSRHYANPANPHVLGYVLEFNKIWGQFFPTWTEMEKIILDVDAGLVQFCLSTTPKSRWFDLFDWCWWKDRFWARWRRLFPPDLWGPYGPWRRVWTVILPPIRAVIATVSGLLGRILGGGRRGG
ncbi:MAG: cpt 2 [Chloroflexi bacterium]|nr:cpt 2 [Chloroflexota bacterium]